MISTVVSDRLDPLAGGILPLPPKLHVAPTQSIFGPSAASANPAPPSVNLHPRDLAATPLPSAPLIAGNASDSVHLTKDKKDESE
ncbi:MAG TPA: hypothetical protein VG326_05640 [Tepidisphaeraceae bacterium]|nr:hypothetical protein [Tepidisphaeraceae bacterium]